MGRIRQFDENEILEIALDVFWRRGYTNAGMQELCSAMGLNPGSLYAVYGSKRDLFLAAIRDYLHKSVTLGMVRITSGESGIAGIESYFDYMIEGILSGKRSRGCFGTNSFIEIGERDDELKDMVAAHFKTLEGKFREALARDGHEAPDAAAAYLVCVAQGMNVLARTAPDRAALEAIVATALDSLRVARAA